MRQLILAVMVASVGSVGRKAYASLVTWLYRHDSFCLQTNKFVFMQRL